MSNIDSLRQMEVSNLNIDQLIARALGREEVERYHAFRLTDISPLRNSANTLMSITQPMPGACLLMSASWALHLRDRYGIPAIAVAGDLRIAGKWVFRGADALPPFGKSGGLIRGIWKGHCWIEVGGMIGDISIFRTAYSLPTENIVRQFVVSTFGEGRGALLSATVDLPDGIRYRPRFVLTERQMFGLMAGQQYLINESMGKQTSIAF